MSLLHSLSYVGAVAAFAFTVVSLASGLLYIAELIEEHSVAAKTLGKRAIYVVISIHVLLYFFDSLPLIHSAFSIFCHFVYLQNFSSTWPFISLTSLPFLSSCLLCIMDHFLWFFYFSKRSRAAHRAAIGRIKPGTGGAAIAHAPSFLDVATFFALCVWFVPLFLFLSLSANDNALPLTGGVEGANGPRIQETPDTSLSMPRHSSLFRSLFGLLPRSRTRRREMEGIIAPPPRTPVPSVPPSPSFFPTSEYSSVPSPKLTPSLGPPPRSPSPRISSSPRISGEELGHDGGLKFRLPPRRAMTSNDALGN